MPACSKEQIIVPKVTPEPTHLRLVGKFVWYDLFTNDLQSTSRFYEELFGWSFSDTSSKEKLVKTIALNGVPIANAIHIDSVKGKMNESRWLSYMSVEDVDRALTVSKKSNGTIYMQPKDLPNRGRVAMVKDPEGAIFAIVTTSDGDPPDQGLIQNRWMGSELWTTNVDASLKYYHLLVGYEQRLVDVDTGPKYRFLVKNGQTRAGIVKIPWDDVKPNWLPYIAVEDVMAIVAKAKELGGKALVEPDKAIREGLLAIIADPSGAVFAVQQF
jgi:predicted enzyme related to lactoylglutathione lyase